MRTAPAPRPRRRWMLSTGVSLLIMAMIVFVMHDAVPRGGIAPSLVAESTMCEPFSDACVPTPASP